MFITHKNNVIQNVADLEWMCRRGIKGMTTDEYWPWLDSVTSGDPPVADYSGETGYTIVECEDEDVHARLAQLQDYISNDPEGTIYNIKYYASKKDSEIDGVKSHFIGDDDAKDARLLAEEWTQIRNERTRLIAETDWMAMSDNTVSAAWKTYRQELRDLPDDQSSKTSYDDIVWPSKPS